jgi:hypothetical protein
LAFSLEKDMKETLADIIQKLSENSYQNEEHVRLSLVSRILKKLDWNLWDPNEVNSEFSVLPHEDKSRVDFALFLNPYIPSVFIEIKAVGKLEGNISQIETQLRDYNRNNTALFSIITDGRKWRFYFSQTGGEFSQKCFKILDLLEDDVEDIELSFYSFLSKSEIQNGKAKTAAQGYLRLNQKQRAMEDALPKARRIILEPPYPSLPEAIVQVASQSGFFISEKEAIQFIDKFGSKKPAHEPQYTPNEIAVKPKKSKGLRKKFPTDGTVCRFTYKGQTYNGRIENGYFMVFHFGKFNSFTAASGAISNTSRNGWRDWELMIPGSSKWILADTWRKK